MRIASLLSALGRAWTFRRAPLLWLALSLPVWYWANLGDRACAQGLDGLELDAWTRWGQAVKRRASSYARDWWGVGATR